MASGGPDPLLTPREGDGSAGGAEDSNSEAAGGAALLASGVPPVHQSRVSGPQESSGKFNFSSLIINYILAIFDLSVSGSGADTSGPMETMETSEDARDAGLWRELEGLLGPDGEAPSVEDVRELVARVRGVREAKTDHCPSRI